MVSGNTKAVTVCLIFLATAGQGVVTLHGVCSIDPNHSYRDPLQIDPTKQHQWNQINLLTKTKQHLNLLAQNFILKFGEGTNNY